MHRIHTSMLLAVCFCLFAPALPAEEADEPEAPGVEAPAKAGQKQPGRGAGKKPVAAPARATPLQRALEAAAGKQSGSVYRAEEEKVEGGSFWRIGLVGDDGKPYDVFVDGAGKVVEIDRIEFTEDPVDRKPATSELMIGSAVAVATKRLPGTVTRALVVEREGQVSWRITIVPKGQTAEQQVEIRGDTVEVASGRAAPLESQPAEGAPGPAAPAQRAVTLSQAAGVAMRTVPGAPFGASLVEWDGRPVWQVRLSGADGRIYHVTVDAADGKPIQANRVDFSTYYEKNRPQPAPVPMDQALRAAAAVVPGDPVEAAAGAARNAAVWNVVVVARQDGQEHQVTVGGPPAAPVSVDGQSLARANAQQPNRAGQGRNGQRPAPGAQQNRGGQGRGNAAQRPTARMNQGLRRALPQMLGMRGGRRRR